MFVLSTSKISHGTGDSMHTSAEGDVGSVGYSTQHSSAMHVRRRDGSEAACGVRMCDAHTYI
jgi:hypothetical protein